MNNLVDNLGKMLSVLKITFLLAAFLYSVNFVFWGAGFSLIDGSFWMNKAEYYKFEFLNVFSVFLEKTWFDTFGRSVVSFRFLSWFCATIAMILPYVCLQNRKSMWQNLSFLTVGFLLYRTAGNFDSDSTTLLFLSILTILLIKYIQNKNKFYILLLSLFSALASSARFPNILIVPLISIILGYVSIKNQKGWRFVLFENCGFITAFICLYAIVLYLLSGEVNLYAYALDGIINHKVGPSHSIGNLLTSYKNSYLLTLGYFANIVIVYLLLKFLSNKITIIICAIFSFVLMFLILKETIYIDYIYDSVYGFLFISLFMYLFYISKSPKDKLSSFIFITFCFIGIAGSDTGMIKLIHYSGIMTPILLCYMKNNKLLNLRFNNVILFTFVVFSIYAKSNNMRFHKVYLPENKYLSHVLIRENDKNEYNRLLQDVKIYGEKNKNIFYGQKYGHLMYSLTDEILPYFCSYWMFKNDFKELDLIVNLMNSDKDRVLFDYTKSDTSYFKKNKLILKTTTPDCNIYTK